MIIIPIHAFSYSRDAARFPIGTFNRYTSPTPLTHLCYTSPTPLLHLSYTSDTYMKDRKVPSGLFRMGLEDLVYGIPDRDTPDNPHPRKSHQDFSGCV